MYALVFELKRSKVSDRMLLTRLHGPGQLRPRAEERLSKGPYKGSYVLFARDMSLDSGIDSKIAML